jgi:hypothetical protein
MTCSIRATIEQVSQLPRLLITASLRKTALKGLSLGYSLSSNTDHCNGSIL